MAALAWRVPLPAGDDDLTPSHHWPTPAVAPDLSPDGGPIMVTVEYRINPADRAAFARSVIQLREQRLRDGAFDWRTMEDAADPGRVLEWFVVGSWQEHMRQHERVTVADRAVQEQVRAFHHGPAPSVQHQVRLGPSAHHAVSRPGPSFHNA